MALFFRKHFGSLRPAEQLAERALARIPNGALVRVEVKLGRNEKHARLFHAAVRKVYDNLPERYDNVYPKYENLLDAIKIATGHFEPVISLEGEIVGKKPGSIAFHKMDQLAFTEFFDSTMDLLLTHFLPEVGKDALIAEVEKLLADKRYQEQDAA